MRKILKKLIIPLLLTIVLVGCTSISKKEAEQLIIKENTIEIGTVQIKESTEKNGKYRIEWRNDENREGGISEVSKSGKIKKIIHYIE